MHDVVNGWSEVIRKVDDFKARVTALENAPAPSPTTATLALSSCTSFVATVMTGITKLEFPNLVGNPVGAVSSTPVDYRAYLAITGNADLTEVVFGPVDVRQFYNFGLNANTVLQNIDLTHSVWGTLATGFESVSLDASDCALTEDCVNAILVRAASFLPLDQNNIQINLLGAGNAAPTGAGLVAKNDLVAAGNSIDTN